MWKNFNFIKILIVVCCLMGCKQKPAQDNSDTLILDFSKAMKSYNKVIFSDFIKEIKAIPLETSDSCLLSNISILRYVDNKFFILDSNQDIIFIFNEYGKFLSKIDHKGNGPEEYVNLFGFDVDPITQTVCLLSAYRGLMYYDYNGKFIKQKEVPCGTCVDFVIDGPQVIIYQGNTTDNINAKENYMLFITDTTNSFSQKYIPFDIEKTGHIIKVYNQPRALEKKEKEILFFYPFSNNIYSIKGKDMTTKYTLDFGDNTLPNDYFNKFDSPEEAYKNLHDGKKYVYAFNSCWENDKYFYIRAIVEGTLRTCFYDKRKNTLKIGLENDPFGALPSICHATNEYFVGFRKMESLHEEIEYANENHIPIDPQVQEIKNKNIDDNPVVFLYYFK
ncbi:6-bladed beta-propeller [Parabacteroides pacaensis]|uniref:6-bladed beta-propeller n=1 Tax=Parabacteroides pacaensis TaxID=2086575 RepID=UPI000D0FD053|nr:6-bladed beta-propeller [Parabacteroides pacaensis]